MLKVGQISFVNVAPYFHFWEDSTIEFIKGPPRYLGQLAQKGEIDLAPLPVVDSFALEDNFEPLGNFGIAATKHVMSVFLFSHKPIETLNSSTFELTSQSSTSVALLKLLIKEKYRLSNPSFFISSDSTTETKPDAVLLIGDKALSEPISSWGYRYDLAQLWNEWTSLPFTFARWVARKSMSPEDKTKMVAALDQNLDYSMSHLEEISSFESSRTGLDKEALRAYLQNFTFRLSSKEEEGITLFRTKLKENGLL